MTCANPQCGRITAPDSSLCIHCLGVDGAIWGCNACGKRSTTQMPEPGTGQSYPGWDESCMLNAVLCDIRSIVLQGGLVKSAKVMGDREVTPKDAKDLFAP